MGHSQNAASNLSNILFLLDIIVLSLGKYLHISPVLYQLHWLPVQHRVHFGIFISKFKAIHGRNIKPRSIYNCRSTQSLWLDPPKGKMLVTIGDRSFFAAAPYL